MAGTIYGPYPVGTFGVYTWCAYQELIPQPNNRALTGTFILPQFKSAPMVSVQIISSVGAPLMQIYAVKVVEIPGTIVETEIAIEAETIAEVLPAGSYYINIIVTGVPMDPPSFAAE